ncbi:MAG TPA: SHOCT domain-containing protein [Dehalococcoidia bacterium]|nr:SHOCT domain-containing protein [Dehalococcoidia bacterium]
MWWDMHPGAGWWGGGWWGIFGLLWMLLFWGGIIALVVWGINKLTRAGGRGETPLEIAQRRYARGEISREEFETIKSTLGGGANPAAGARGG